MNRVARVNATDRRIVYVGLWQGDQNTMWSFSTPSTLFFMFRGTGITLYGRTQSVFGGGSLLLILDANHTNIVLNGTTSGTEVSPMYHAADMEDGDHQLYGLLSVTGAPFEIDYFEIENSSGDGFDLLSAGPAAQNVPTRAVTVDNNSPDIIFHSESMWKHDSNGIYYYDKTISYTQTLGSSLSYSFNGVAIWYYGDIGPGYGFFNVSIDGSTPQRLTAENNTYLYQRLLWSNVSLDPGSHNLTLTHDDTRNDMSLSLDFFRVLPEEAASTTSFSTTSTGVLPTDVQPTAPANQSHTNRVPLVVGLTLGLLALVVGALGGFGYRYRRRQRTPVDLDAPPLSPYPVPPMGQADLQSPDGKYPPQPALSPRSPVDTSDPSMSSDISELTPPPSYQPPSQDRRVAVVQ